jgi:hypothetical protein
MSDGGLFFSHVKDFVCFILEKNCGIKCFIFWCVVL